MSSNPAFKDIRKILVPTDGSDNSMRAAEYALGIAQMLSAEISVVFVIDEIVLDQMKALEKDQAEQELKTDGHHYVNYVTGLAEKKKIKSSSTLAKGRPFEQIVHLAREQNCGLIVMGTYGRKGADRILIGSVAERVIEFAPCPVLVIK